MKRSYITELRRMRRSFFYLIPGTVFLLLSAILVILFQLKTGYGDLLYSLEGFSFLIPLFLGLFLTLGTTDPKACGAFPASGKNRTPDPRKRTPAAGKTSQESFFRSFLGLFLADLTLFLIPMLFLFLYPLFLLPFGSVSLLSSYVSLFGLFLYGAFLIALYRFSFSFLSSRTSVLVCGGILTLLSLLWRIFASVRLFFVPSYLGYHFGTEGFLHGRFSLFGTFFFAGGSTLLLFLAEFIHRPLRKPLWKGICGGACAALFVLLNAASLLLPDRILHPTVTGKDTFVLSESTTSLLKELDTDVTLSYVCKRGIRDADADLYAFFSGFADLSPHVRLRLVQPEELPAEIFPDGEVENRCLVVSSENRYRVLTSSSLYHYRNSVLNADLSADLYLSCLSAFFSYAESGSAEGLDETLISYGQTLYESASCTKAYFDGDHLLSNAIRYVTSRLSAACYVENETCETPDAAFLQSVASVGFDLSPLQTLSSIPSDCKLLILHALKKDLDMEELNALKNYLSAGGNLLLTTSYLTGKADLPHLSELLADYGMGMEEKKSLICEKDTSYLPAKQTDTDYLFYAHVASGTYTGDFDGQFFVSAAAPIEILPDASAAVTPWIYSSNQACRIDENGEEDKEHPEKLICGAVSEKDNSLLFWLSSEDSLSEVADFLSEESNYRLLENGLSVVCDTDYREVAVEGKQISSVSLTVTDGACALLSLFFLSLPVLLLFLCVVLFRSEKASPKH